ncbi:Type I phosphodiesterase / nucleotide pyrophosphatase [Saccharopolyspora antimicrobica]|uniref:Type I phosphodiesterase / nucleotide pyrophosphatase n=1 Tax=Saccharopolyspora antimicrobica TaxID=455193 RepID=A0A1I5IBP9_9PSEU|nr:alkaline phosphatase family protein [Saccharopolyspora antimicrobica]RKT85548.1 type I phosphodiesterase/nucleotide pyrophosphatase [Saccharopolyspora antimicrobica]SFO58017.1 Type I phosphodiesterase / nucleotide pyrophosphatase [Saccharopolyspora antimicrobica]
MDWIVAPDGNGRALPDVLPSLLGSLGVAGFTDTIGFPECRNAAVLLVDGLGHDLLRDHAEDAPFLASLLTRPPLTAGFPTTTVTSLTSLGTGRCAGEHGIVGYTFAEPSGGLLHPLSWSSRGDRRSLLERWPPEQAQPMSTVFDRAAAAGVDVRTAVPAEFEGSGLTRAAMRGAEFRGQRAFGDLAAEMLVALNADGPALCYGYHGHLDLLGHVHGPGSLPWRLQLTQLDGLVAMLADRLPPGAVLAVIADHGMVEADPATAFDADTDPALREGVRMLGGEARARHVYVEPGALGDVLAAWQERIGDQGLVLTGEQAIDEGWFGPVVVDAVRPRIGDVLAVMRDSEVIRSVAEPGEAALRGQHGSLTAAEQLIPLLVLGG